MTLERVDISQSADRLQVTLHRHRYDFVLERLSDEDDVLEIGVGAGVFCQELAQGCRSYVGIEYDPVACEEARLVTGGQLEIIEADARSLPFEDARFSFIVCLEVLEHLGDYKSALDGMHRCLRPGGTVIISVPYRHVGGKGLKNEHHPYEPGERELVVALSESFKNVEVYYQDFDEHWWWKIARLLHIRRLLGLEKIYADLSAGLPHATARLQIRSKAKGLKEGLILVASHKKTAVPHG